MGFQGSILDQAMDIKNEPIFRPGRNVALATSKNTTLSQCTDCGAEDAPIKAAISELSGKKGR